MFSSYLSTTLFIFFFIVTRHATTLSTTPSPRLINSFTISFDHSIPVAFILSQPRTKFLYTRRNLLVSLLLILSGDVELNPGPFNICTYNIRSLTNPLHYTSLSSLATDYCISLFCISETWITPHTTNFELKSSIPDNFSLYSFPRPTSSTNKCIVGGGTAFLLHNSCSFLSSASRIFKSFEMSSITFKVSSSKLTVFNIYRPPPSSSSKCRTYVPFSTFLTEFQDFLTTASTTPNDFLITGDFNIHIDCPNTDTNKFLSVLSSSGLSQHVNFPTHISSKHILDLVISPASSTLNPTVSYSPTSVSDHYPILTTLSLSRPPPPVLVTHFYRCLKSINIDKFQRDILSTKLITHPPTSLSELVSCYNTTLSSLLDKHAPKKSKTVSQKPKNPWYTPALHSLKSNCRRLHRIWASSHSSTDLSTLRSATNHYHASILKTKRSYYQSLISSAKSDSKKLWHTINNLLYRHTETVLPSCNSPTDLSNKFASFFSDKINTLRSKLDCNSSDLSPHCSPPVTPPTLCEFTPATIDEISKLISSSNNSTCDLDPLPTTILKKCSVLIPTITNIVNLSLSTGLFPDNFKSCSVHPLIKKPSLDKDTLSNYRPISHLSFLSKLTERIVKSRLTDHLSTNCLFNSHQSAYSKYHSTETTLLSVHDHLIKSISTQKLTALCLLDLSAAFDTIDHNILLTRLSSWFGLSNTVLFWFRSYLSCRTFSVSIENSSSTSSKLLYGVPQGSVLGPYLFILYTTPLSHLINSSSSISHHLYADDTQLFTSFSARDCTSGLNSLESTISLVSSWMSANFLSLNPSKTEFMLIGNSRQLSKIENIALSLPDNVTIKPVPSARNLGVIFDSHLSFSDHISSVSKTCFGHIRNLRRIRSSLDQSTATTIATSIIHSKLDYCNSLFVNLPKFELNRLQSILNTAARAITHTSKFSKITPVLKSLHWLKITERIHYKIISLTYSVLQSNKPSYLHNLLSIQNKLNTRSFSSITLIRPPNPSSLLITNRSFNYTAPFLWNKLPTDMRLPSTDKSSPLSLSSPVFHKRLKTYLFHLSFPP